MRRLGGVQPPREFVFMDRAAVGLGSVFMHLKAEINWHRLFHELIADFDPASGRPPGQGARRGEGAGRGDEGAPSINPKSSCAGLTRASTGSFVRFGTWMAGSSPAMTTLWMITPKVSPLPASRRFR